MSVKLLIKYYLEFLRLKGGCRGSSESTLVKMPHCWKARVMAHMLMTGMVQVKRINWGGMKYIKIFSRTRGEKGCLNMCQCRCLAVYRQQITTSFLPSVVHIRESTVCMKTSSMPFITIYLGKGLSSTCKISLKGHTLCLRLIASTCRVVALI